MKKITFFLSLLLTVVGITTTQAQKLLKLSDITDGRVITLKGCAVSYSGYIKGVNAGTDNNFNPRETAFVVESITNEGEETSEFYLKNFSDGMYLQRPAIANADLTLGSKDGAAVFYVISVDQNANANDINKLESPGDVIEEKDKVIRFVTTASNNVKAFLNCGNKNPILKYATGKGSFSVFSVYDAAELCCEEYGKNLGTEYIYAGVPIHSNTQEQAMSVALQDYDGSPSEDNYNTVLAAAECDKKEFDPNLYYLIESDEESEAYMEVTDDKKLSWSSGASGNASKIWRFQPEADTGKYFMTTQGVSCSEPTSGKQVELSEGGTSYYLIESPVGIYAFDCNYNEIRPGQGEGNNGGKGLQKKGTTDGDKTVVGWGTLPQTSKWKLKFVDAYDLVVSSAGWASFKLPFAVELPKKEGFTAYYAVGETDDNTAIVLKDAGTQIPANCPVIINGPEDHYTLTILPAEPKIESPALDGNKFKGTLLPAIPENSESVYALGLWKGEVYFCKLNTKGSANTEEESSDTDEDSSEADGNTATPEETSTIAANKAYYEAPENVATNGVNALRFSFGTATGIAGASASAPTASRMWFDLKGRRVLYPGKGIYVNAAGEKVLFK